MTKSHVIIVINAGSSSIKFSVFGEEEDPVLVFKGQIDGLHAGHAHFLRLNSSCRRSIAFDDVAELLGQFEQARLGADDFLILGHGGVSWSRRGGGCTTPTSSAPATAHMRGGKHRPSD